MCASMRGKNMLRILSRTFALGAVAFAASGQLPAQIAVAGVTTSATQAIIQYTAPVAQACSMQVADMNRSISITSAVQAGGQVTVQTAAPHGLLAGAVIYLENSGGWNGWQVISSVLSNASFVFASALSGGVPGGNAGVLVDDVNPALFSGAGQDSRAGNVTDGQTAAAGQLLSLAQQAGKSRTFVIGKRTAEVALDGNRYSRALQAYSRHHFTLTCGTQSFDQEFRTANIPTGDTHNEGPLADRNNPGQYAYPTVQWNNQAQSLIDPVTGLRSIRATAPQGTPSTAQTFATAIDSQTAWNNPTGPLANTGAASFTGPCASGTCPLFLRADNLSITAGATYDSGNNSLDWIKLTVSQTSISGACSGDDCKIVACLTVNGVSCASGNLETALSATPASYTFGSGNLMDLWQSSGPPPFSRVDVSAAGGTVNYSIATKQLSLANGSVFNIKWSAGSAINVGGGRYTIASVQNERLLTLVSGPTSNLAGVTYSANNFGALIWKKTRSANQIAIGYATYVYGSSTMPNWSAATDNDCSTAVIVNGVTGYNCFIGTEIYWLAADGSAVRDLGQSALTYYNGDWSDGYSCGQSGQAQQFDPQNGDVWYCLATANFDPQEYVIVQAHYMGPHTQYTPGQRLPDCSINRGVQPCILFTDMQPSVSAAIPQSAPTFNPALSASGYQVQYYLFGGVSADGDMLIYGNQGSQDTLGWLFIYTLGDRTPTGTTNNSLRMVAAASTYLTAPLSWCTVHYIETPDAGWVGVYSNNTAEMGLTKNFQMTMTNSPLNTNSGVSGGLTACPSNPFGIAGAVCTAITVTGSPAGQQGGAFLQNVQVGDVMSIGTEYIRILSMASPTQFIVQRGYVSNIGNPGGLTLTMNCGTQNTNNARVGVWNYRNDPYGVNPNFTTILADPTIANGHNFIGGGVFVAAAEVDFLGSLCPVALGGVCYQVRLGDLATASQSQQIAVAANPSFAGVFGMGGPGSVDSHPGPCFNLICLDGRPFLGGGSSYPISSTTLGTPNTPFQPVSGQLWKTSGAQSVLNRKYLTTFAYAGRWPLVDISGAGSLIGAGAQDSYKYCYAIAAGECVAGSSPGDVYVNAPFVDYPYCYYPGIANPTDDALSICIGDLGAFMANLVEYSVAMQDNFGAAQRRLGPNYAKWNQFDVYWNGFMSPNGGLMGSQVRWMDGVRTEDLLTVLPPFPEPDGISRNNFVPVNLKIDPPRALPVQSAIVEFGYVENGGAANYYCTSRQETCVATGATVNQAAPFNYEQTESYTPAPCSNGCTIAIPALSGRALYYRWKYLGASGQVIGTSQAHVILTQ